VGADNAGTGLTPPPKLSFVKLSFVRTEFTWRYNLLTSLVESMPYHKSVIGAPHHKESESIMLVRRHSKPDLDTDRTIPHEVAKSSKPDAMDVLEELDLLLEEYAPAWYTQEQRERVQFVLRPRRKS
jgi:hypothetical protein